MKSKISKIIVMAVMFLILFLNNTVYAFGIDLKLDKETVKKDDEVILTIKPNERVLATNFDVEFDSTMFKYVDSDTEGLMAGAKENKVVCIYFDINMQGQDEFQLKFKTLKDNTRSNFSISNAKFSTDISKESYEGENIDGINGKVEVKGSNYDIVPYTIIAILVFFVILILLLIIKIKRKKKF
jgi:hypothetical protein